MYNTGVEIPRVSFSALSYSGIPVNSFFMGFDSDNLGKLSKLDSTGTVTVIEGGSGGGGGIALIDLSAVLPLTYNNSTGSFSINQSSGLANGYLSSTDWNTFNNKVSQINGMENFVTKFTSNSSLITASHIYDNGTCLAIGYGPTAVSSHKFSVNGEGSNASNGGYFINDNVLADSTGYGLVGASIKTTGTNIGVSGRAITGNTGTNIGIIGTASGGASNYAIQLEDGTQAIAGRFLKNIVDGKANWANITAADVSGVQESLTLTTAGSSGEATLVGNTLNIPQYSGGGGGGLTWPAHIEYDETNKTLWVSGNNTGVGCTTYGYRALSTSSAGISNSAFGFNALRLNQASYNSAFGNGALSSNTTGSQNTAVGDGSLDSNTTAIYNTAVGISALSTTTTGGSNTAIGAYALALTTTSYNTAVGHNALQILQTGSNNTMVGAYAASSFTEGSYNVALGDNIGVVMTASSNVMIGSGARADSYNSSIVIGRSAQANGDNQFVIGSSSYNAGTIATESVSTNRTWRVKINGTDYKILLATV